MITGRQIREAMRLLEWDRETLCTRANVTHDVAKRAESADSTPSISLHQAGLIQQAFQRAGVRFGRSGAVVMIQREGEH